MLGARLRRYQGVNPYDYLLHNMNAKLRPLGRDSSEFQMLLLYANNGLSRSSYNSSIVNIFEVTPGGKREYQTKDIELKEQRIFSKTHNHFMLWHGTGPQNIISIMERGLQIKPPNAAATGSIFGDGIYFADSLEKSFSYAPFQNNYNYILLCEVAIGNVLNINNLGEHTSPPYGYHSLRFAGSIGPHFRFNIVNNEGITIPLGNCSNI